MGEKVISPDITSVWRKTRAALAPAGMLGFLVAFAPLGAQSPLALTEGYSIPLPQEVREMEYLVRESQILFWSPVGGRWVQVTLFRDANEWGHRIRQGAFPEIGNAVSVGSGRPDNTWLSLVVQKEDGPSLEYRALDDEGRVLEQWPIPFANVVSTAPHREHVGGVFEDRRGGYSVFLSTSTESQTVPLDIGEWPIRLPVTVGWIDDALWLYSSEAALGVLRVFELSAPSASAASGAAAVSSASRSQQDLTGFVGLSPFRASSGVLQPLVDPRSFRRALLFYTGTSEEPTQFTWEAPITIIGEAMRPGWLVGIRSVPDPELVLYSDGNFKGGW